MFVTAVLIITALISALWAYSTYRHNYWASRGIPTLPGSLPIIGHLLTNMSTKEHRWIYMDKCYKNHGADKISGMYEMFKPTIVIGDPELMKAILIKDFDHFVDRRNFTFENNEQDKIWNHVLTNMTGDAWKSLRSVLSPTFSSGKMKGMYPLVENKGDILVNYINKQLENQSKIPLRKTFGLYTLEIISSCAFGMETNTLVDGDSIFVQKVESMFKMSIGRIFKLILFMISPKLMGYLGFSVSNPEIFFFKDVVKETIRQREAGNRRGDFLDLMLDARKDQNDENSKASKIKICDEIVVSNSILFILAGFDTTANTLCFTFFELAKNPTEQERVREELQDIIKEHGTLTYQGIMEANLLDACLSETLRLNPPAHFTERQCTKPYKIPGTDLIIPEKMPVGIPIWSLHRDPRYWSDPDIFSLDRFLPQNRDKIKSGTYLPFGLGPRNCIGMRFALMEAKVAIAKVLLNFELTCIPGKEELEYQTIPGIMRPTDELSITFKSLNKKE